MAPIPPINPVGSTVAAVAEAVASGPAQMSGALGGHGLSFTNLVETGLREVDAKVAKADALIQAYAVGDPVPVHQVTLAIEEARTSVEMAVQIRSKLADTYHDLMNMQL